MCGINLCFGEANVKLMNSILDHRGIRSKYEELTNDLFLGHVRLPIQGLSMKEDHPMTIGMLTGAFVGEIFNYKDYDAESKTDLPLLLNTLMKEGPAGFKKFDGFWAAIVYDILNNKVHIFTDPLAKKPLYLRWEPFAVSSEVKSLTSLETNTFDETFFSAVAKWGYCPEERTPFNEITKMSHGIHVVYDPIKKAIELVQRYISIKPNPNLSLFQEIGQAVENRTVSDIPISLLMSGGLDSTIIYYWLRDFTDDLTIFHVDNDEAEYLDYVDFRPQDKLIKIDIKEENYNLDFILNTNDGPVDLGSMIPQYLLAQEIKKHGFNVCLSGDGADELFGGYKRITEYDSQYSDIYHELIYYHLPRLDKMMMAHTVELRCPFLAHNVISKALSLPYKDRINKSYLKECFRGLVPDPIIDRVKMPLRHRTERLSRHNLIARYRAIEERINVV